MHWFIWLLPLLSGAADALCRVFIKTSKIHRLTLIAGGYLFALPFYVAWLMWEGIPETNLAFWKTIVIHVPLLTFANVLFVEAHRRSSLIVVSAYMSFVPAFSLLYSPWVGGRPTLWGYIGVGVIVCGVYVLNVRTEHVGWAAPFKAAWKDVGARFIIAATFILGATSNLDYLALINSNGPFFLLVDHGLIMVVTMAVAGMYMVFGKVPRQEFFHRGIVRPLAGYGLVLAASVILHLLAFRWIPIVSYVIAGKRCGAIFSAVAFGVFLGFVAKRQDFQKEREELRYRIPGILLMIAGMIVIILWGRRS